MPHEEELNFKEYKKQSKIAKFLIGFPLALLLVSVFVWAIIGYPMPDAPKSYLNFLEIIGPVLYILMFIGFFGSMIGIPLGLIRLSKVGKIFNKEEVTFDNRSGQGKKSVVPEEIRGWNWGAAGLTIIWGIPNKVMISFISLIPIAVLLIIPAWGFISFPLSIIAVLVIMGTRGNHWAWKYKKWSSLEQFKKTQKKWKYPGIIMSILAIIFSSMLIIIWILDLVGFYE